LGQRCGPVGRGRVAEFLAQAQVVAWGAGESAGEARRAPRAAAAAGPHARAGLRAEQALGRPDYCCCRPGQNE